jgi:hypothetical protein
MNNLVLKALIALGLGFIIFAGVAEGISLILNHNSNKPCVTSTSDVQVSDPYVRDQI